MGKRFAKFFLLLSISIGITFGIHYLIYLKFSPDISLEVIQFVYKFNVGITLLLTSSLILASRFLKDQIGFIFLFSGLIKIGIFLFLVEDRDHILDQGLFLHFFLPYTVCMLIEIISVVGLIKNANASKDR